MKRRMGYFLIALILLVAGRVIFNVLNPTNIESSIDWDFNAWFWERRGLDLVVQVVLVFAGALGIAAILPLYDENDD